MSDKPEAATELILMRVADGFRFAHDVSERQATEAEAEEKRKSGLAGFKHDDADDVPITLLPGLPMRIVNRLRFANNIRTIGDIKRMTDAELLRCQNFGLKSLRELRKAVADLEAELQ